MSIYADHPAVAAFKENELKTLHYLHNWRLLKDFSELDTNIQFAISNYKFPNRLENFGFEFSADFLIEIEKFIHRVYIGAKIVGDYDEATYMLAITDRETGEELIRKFHFDFAHPKIPTKQPVPIFHLQYGGKMPTYMKNAGLNDSKLDHWLSVPRLSFSPINLALLLDMAFCELGTVQTRKIVEEPEWRNLIFLNENFLLTNYYTSIANHCTGTSYTNKNLIRDFCYGR